MAICWVKAGVCGKETPVEAYGARRWKRGDETDERDADLYISD